LTAALKSEVNASDRWDDKKVWESTPVVVINQNIDFSSSLRLFDPLLGFALPASIQSPRGVDCADCLPSLGQLAQVLLLFFAA
jgi:hypothetical protein